MALLNKLDETKLRSLSYGDKSSTPYITVDINNQKVKAGGVTIPVANNGNRINSAIIDTARITRFLLDKPEWSLKQISQQFMNIKPNFGYINGTPYRLPTSFQLYTPLNTLAQVAATGVGGHIERQGLVPGNIISNIAGTGTYEDIKKGELSIDVTGIKNPLVQLTSKLITYNIKPSKTAAGTLLSNILSFITDPQDPLYSYVGGPKSFGGIGNTTIRRYYNITDSVGRSNLNGFIINNKERDAVYREDSNGSIVSYGTTMYYPELLGVSNKAALLGGDYSTIKLPINNDTDTPAYLNQQQQLTPVAPNSPLLFDIFTPASGQTVLDNGYIKYNGNSSTYMSWPKDNIITYNNGFSSVSFKSPGAGWFGISREVRVESGRRDGINLTPLFTTNKGSEGNDRINIGGNSYDIRDLIKFRIEAIDTDNPDQKTWMIFRAFLTDLTDNVTADWNGQRYVGRGEKSYTYQGHDRTVNVSFKVAALSAEEMEPMYQKLNYLMSNMMGDYNNNGIMRGPFTKMTIGNWFDRQPCVITSLTYKVPNDSPWEVSMDSPERNIDGEFNVKQLTLPHIVEVSLTFIPIGVQKREGNDYVNVLPQKGANQSNIAQNEIGYPFITGSKIPNPRSEFEKFAISGQINASNAMDELAPSYFTMPNAQPSPIIGKQMDFSFPPSALNTPSFIGPPVQ